MHCPNCQNDLVEIPTLEGPQLDVCPGQHGLWLDGGEINLFVENYRALASQGPGAGVAAVHWTTCPKCGGLLDQESVLATALLACRACHGWWLPNGSLTQLNDAPRGGAAQIRFDAAGIYRQDEKRGLQSLTREAGQARRPRHQPCAEHVWFWTLFFSAALLFAALILVAGIRKIVA